MTRALEIPRAGRRMALAALAALAAAVLLPSCGGGVDSGGTGSAPVTLAVGPITGFGSVVVGGVHYDDRDADVADEEGRVRTAADLRLGMSTRIDAGAVAAVNGRLEAAASAIRVDVQVLGPLEAVDAASGTLRVLGQAVAVTRGTALDGLATGLASLRVGDVVAAYGDVDLAGARIVATRLELATGAGRYVLRGAIGAVDAGGERITLGGAVVGLAAIPAGDRPATLAVGQRVRARLQPTQLGGAWVASALRSDEAPRLESRENVEIEGRITAFVSAQRFSVDGYEVDATGASFPDGTQGLALGARVEVEGAAVGGVLVARQVAIESDDDDEDGEAFELEGGITAVDAGDRSFVLRGLTVSHDDATRFERGDASGLLVGRKVTAKGVLSDDGTRLVARSIEFP